MEVAFKLLAGVIAGAFVGLLLGRAKTCSGQACQARPQRVFLVIAGAFFGAAVAWYLMG